LAKLFFKNAYVGSNPTFMRFPGLYLFGIWNALCKCGLSRVLEDILLVMMGKVDIPDYVTAEMVDELKDQGTYRWCKGMSLEYRFEGLINEYFGVSAGTVADALAG